MSNAIRLKLFSIVIYFILSLTATVQADVSFSGYLSGVSTYVWRGIKANNGPALQTDAAFSLSCT